MNPSDETRSKITGLFEKFKDSLTAYHDYAQQVTSLSEVYHEQRFKEIFGSEVEELTLLATLNAYETPKSLDEFLAKLGQCPQVKRIIHDRKAHTYQIYV